MFKRTQLPAIGSVLSLCAIMGNVACQASVAGSVEQENEAGAAHAVLPETDAGASHATRDLHADSGRKDDTADPTNDSGTPSADSAATVDKDSGTAVDRDSATKLDAVAALDGSSAGLSLRVVGNQLLDAHSNPVRLLGVNRSGQEFKCVQDGSPGSLGWGIFDGPTDLASAKSIASWKATAVRVPLNEDCWLGINGVNPLYGGTAYQSAILAYVATLHSAGLYTIVDLHWNAPGTQVAASQQPMPDADHAIDFWTSVATAFSADPATVFDLYNEPFLYDTYTTDPAQDVWDCWLNGCSLNQYMTGGAPYTLPMTWSAVGMQTLVTTVRATNAKNPIMVGGLGWADDMSGWLSHEPTDPEGAIVASWHSYPGEICDASTCWASNIAPIAALVPVVIGEIGDSVCSGGTYASTLLPWADSQAISYLGWTWNTWGDCDNILITDYSGIPTSNFGKTFEAHLAAVSP